MRRALDQLIARWRDQYDFVVIDTRSMSEADDATALAPKTDGVLFVVARRHAGARRVRESSRLLAQTQAKILGLVFNRWG